MKQIKPTFHAGIMLCALALGCMGITRTARASEVAPIPDFTQGGKKDANHDWKLGPTGVRGWIVGSKGQTAAARQILVTAVDTGSPADGVLRVNDVILGMDGKPFAGDARILLARALTAAEEKSGELRLIRWREGKSEDVELKPAVLGKYSHTAPYDCPKSKKICAYLLAYALPLKSLYLTGKKPCSVEPLNAKEVTDVIAAGRDYLSPTGRHGVTYDGRTTEQLLAGLSSWSPAVRKRSAQTLGKREADFVPQL